MTVGLCEPSFSGQSAKQDIAVWTLEAMEKLRTEKPKLILSDWNMPEKSGLDFLKEIRAAENGTPFGFVTSEASVEMRSLALSSGAAFMLSKPFTPDDIHDAIAPILD